MQVRTAIMIQALRQWQARLEAITERQLRDAYFHERMDDLVVGCFDLLEYSPTLDVAAWLRRRPRRIELAEPSIAARASAGRLAIQELVALTISDLEASACFRPHVESGVLPMKAPRKISAAHQQALTEGHQRYRAALTKDEFGGRFPSSKRCLALRRSRNDLHRAEMADDQSYVTHF